jgi:DNA-binding NarL/FixJ family response regulator
MAESDRSERLLALLLLQNMKSTSAQQKIVQLNVAGFSNVEIADILQTTSAAVAQSLYASSRKPPRRGRAKTVKKNRSRKR